jgi:hypothetical protein
MNLPRFRTTMTAGFLILLMGTSGLLAQDVNQLVQAFETSLSKSPAAQEEAALQLLKRYQEYKGLVANHQVSEGTARVLDDQLVRMTQEVWGEVAKRNSGLSYVVPVGTLGDRSDPKYIPGKSDKDFIPKGTGATEAAQDFTTAFEKKWGIKPGSVDVNALDPTKIETWPDRVIAAADYEKYNTRGGVAWLEREMHAKKPNLWQFNPQSGGFTETNYSTLVKEAPPPLTAADALGFNSDNLKFRNDLIAKYGDNSANLALTQAKYDLRNVHAFGLAGGKLTKSEVELINAARMFRNGKSDAAVGWIMKITGNSDPDAALAAYLRNMNELSERMSKEIVNKHLSLMAQSGSKGLALEAELAAALRNLPPKYRAEVQEQVTKQLGASRWKELNQMAETFTQRVIGYEALDQMARSRFGKSFNELTAAEKKLLQETAQTAEGYAMKLAKAAGISIAAAFAIYAVVEAYETNEKAGRSGAAAAAGRTAIELVQLGYPPLVVAELLGRLGAGVVGLGVSAYQDDGLEKLYQQFQKDPSRDIDLLLNTYGVDRYSSGALRQMSIEMREENPLLTDAEIDQRIRNYFLRRLTLEEQGKKFTEFSAKAESWIYHNEIPLVPGGDWLNARSDNEDLRQKDEKRYYLMLGTLMQHYENIKRRFRDENRAFTENDIWHELYLIYRGGSVNPAEFAGNWTEGGLVITELPVLEMMKQSAVASKTPQNPKTETLEGCDITGEAMPAVEKALKSLQEKLMQMNLKMTCDRDPNQGGGSFLVIPPKDLGENAQAGEPIPFRWRFMAPATLSCEADANDGKLKMQLTAQVKLELTRYTLSGTWTAYMATDPKKTVLLSGTWKAIKPRESGSAKSPSTSEPAKPPKSGGKK